MGPSLRIRKFARRRSPACLDSNVPRSPCHLQPLSPWSHVILSPCRQPAHVPGMVRL